MRLASGGNGGQGGNVYIRPVKHLSSLSSLTKQMKAHNGYPGQGSWMHGRRGEDLMIEVPYGTVVKERRGYNDEKTIENIDGLDETWNDWRRRMKAEALEDPEALQARRRRLFVLYPALAEGTDLLESDRLEQFEMTLLEDERRARLSKLSQPPLEIDFLEAPQVQSDVLNVSADTDQKQPDNKILVLKGGQGGFGNPYFTSTDVRAPKYATRGKAGETMRLEFELKTLADVGLVGLPNAGKRYILFD